MNTYNNSLLFDRAAHYAPNGSTVFIVVIAGRICAAYDSDDRGTVMLGEDFAESEVDYVDGELLFVKGADGRIANKTAVYGDYDYVRCFDAVHPGGDGTPYTWYIPTHLDVREVFVGDTVIVENMDGYAEVEVVRGEYTRQSSEHVHTVHPYAGLVSIVE